MNRMLENEVYMCCRKKSITVAKAEFEFQIERMESASFGKKFLKEIETEFARVVIRKQEKECFHNFDGYLRLLAQET